MLMFTTQERGPSAPYRTVPSPLRLTRSMVDCRPFSLVPRVLALTSMVKNSGRCSLRAVPRSQLLSSPHSHTVVGTHVKGVAGSSFPAAMADLGAYTAATVRSATNRLTSFMICLLLEGRP